MPQYACQEMLIIIQGDLWKWMSSHVVCVAMVVLSRRMCVALLLFITYYQELNVHTVYITFLNKATEYPCS